MKRAFIDFILLFILMFLPLISMGQNYWVGGTPGSESDWNNPKNWSQNHVPDWTDLYVVVPDVSTQSRHYPIIRNEIEPISYLEIQSMAKLEVSRSGVLYINGSNTFNYGLLNLGSIENEGLIHITNTGIYPLETKYGIIIGEGLMDLGEFNVALQTANNAIR